MISQDFSNYIILKNIIDSLIDILINGDIENEFKFVGSVYCEKDDKSNNDLYIHNYFVDMCLRSVLETKDMNIEDIPWDYRYLITTSIVSFLNEHKEELLKRIIKALNCSYEVFRNEVKDEYSNILKNMYDFDKKVHKIIDLS